MHKKLLILSLLSAIILTEACVDVCRGRAGNHFASNPRGCSWYYRCNVGREAEEGKCPEPYYFNYVNQTCDWKENVGCEDNFEFPSTCPSVGITTIQHPNVCSKYTVCIDGREEDRDCPEGLHFSPFDGKCVLPYLAGCTKDRDFCLARNNGEDFTERFRTVNQRNCQQYYVCFKNEEFGIIGAAIMRCGPGQHVNPTTFRCEDPVDAQCDATEVPPPLPFPGLTINYDCTEDDEGKALIHPESNCFWFFCTSGKSHLFQCSGEYTHFDTSTQKCEPEGCEPQEEKSQKQEGEFVGRNYENEEKLINRFMELVGKGMRQ